MTKTKNWNDMTPDEQDAFVKNEARRISHRLYTKALAAAKRSEKKVGADEDTCTPSVSLMIYGEVIANLE